MPTRRLVVLALLLLVLPAAFTAVFLTRFAVPAVEPAAQPGGRIAGRLMPRSDVPHNGALGGVEVRLHAVARDGAMRDLDSIRTSAEGRFEFDAPPVDGHYVVRVAPESWISASASVSLAAGAREDLEIPVWAAAILELDFTHASGELVTGGRWSVEGEVARSWFSPWRGEHYQRRGTFRGASLEIDGLPPGEVTVRVRLDGGDSVDLVIDLAPGRSRHEVAFGSAITGPPADADGPLEEKDR